MVVVFVAVPPTPIERRVVRQIVRELNTLATGLSRLPASPGSTPRGAGPATKIVKSLQRVNATLDKAYDRGSLRPAGFARLGREFASIGTTLRALGRPSKTTARKSKRKTTPR